MDENTLKIQLKLRWLLQALLISAVMLAPVWGQIHKTVHGINTHIASEQTLFSEHAEGSLVCQALDHLASDNGLQMALQSIEAAQPDALFLSRQFAQHVATLTLAFTARAPPHSL